MKKLIATACILLAITMNVSAGDIPGDRQPPPPPPSGTSSTTTASGSVVTDLILTLINLIR